MQKLNSLKHSVTATGLHHTIKATKNVILLLQHIAGIATMSTC